MSVVQDFVQIPDLKSFKRNKSARFHLQAKFDTLVNNHQRSLEELKAKLSSDPAAAAGQEQDVQELRATLEALKMEHQLETENLKTKHKIEAAILTKEREDLCGRLQELKDQGRAEAAADKLQKAERLQAELRERLELSEKKMTDYQALQKAQAESQEEIRKLEEKLRVTANQLQAIQADRYTSHDANVRCDQRPIRTRQAVGASDVLTLDLLFR